MGHAPPSVGNKPRCGQRAWPRFGSVLFAALAAVVGIVSAVSAQQAKPEEYQVKAVYLYNFGRFIEWPASAVKDDSFDICVLGRDPFGPVLDTTVAGEMIDSHKLTARRMTSVQAAKGCRILFISSSEAMRVKDILNSADTAGILTVSDMPGFTGSGGIIQFVLKENKVRFEVNLDAADKAGLTFSSQLLKVATDIRKSPGTPGVRP